MNIYNWIGWAIYAILYIGFACVMAKLAGWKPVLLIAIGVPVLIGLGVLALTLIAK